MNKNLSRWIDPTIVIGLIISIAISIITIFVSNDASIGLIVGLLSTIITLLVDVIARIQKVENTIFLTAHLSEVLASDKALCDTIHEIVVSYEQLKKWKFTHYEIVSKRAIDTCRDTVNGAAIGAMTVKSKTPDEYGSFKGIDSAQKSMKVTHVTSMEFWKSSTFGRKIFDANLKAVKRGVKITRLFALSEQDVLNSIDVLREQENAGINVLIVKPSHFERKDQEDFIIFDDKILVRNEMIAGQYATEHIILRSADVERANQDFHRLSLLGEKVDDFIARTNLHNPK